MKTFLEYKDELHKCSQCGLCMSVCPLYKEFYNDCANARGLCSMLNGVVCGDLEFDETILKYLDKCISNKDCKKCMEFCPSEINLREIFESAMKFDKNNL